MPFTMLLQVIVNVIYYVVTGECHLLCCYRLMPFTMLLQVIVNAIYYVVTGKSFRDTSKAI